MVEGVAIAAASTGWEDWTVAGCSRVAVAAIAIARATELVELVELVEPEPGPELELELEPVGLPEQSAAGGFAQDSAVEFAGM